MWAFDGSGRHLRTLDGLTGATLLSFGYDAAGRLLRVEDADGHKTLIERDGTGTPLAILAPDGRRTLLAIAGGRLTKITDPLGAARGLGYDAGGFLNHQDLPSGRHSDYRYGASGRLIEAVGAAGQKRTLARTDLADGTVQVDVTTGEGRKRRYTSQRTAGGGVRRTLLTTSGSQTQLVIGGDGTRTLTLPSGEIRVTKPVVGPTLRRGRVAGALPVDHDAVGQDDLGDLQLRRGALGAELRLRADLADVHGGDRARHDHDRLRRRDPHLHDDDRGGAPAGDDARRARAPGPHRGRRTRAPARRSSVTYDGAVGSRRSPRTPRSPATSTTPRGACRRSSPPTASGSSSATTARTA